MSDRCSPETSMGFEAIAQRNALAEFSSNRRNCQDVADVRWMLEEYSALSARMKVAERYVKELESLPNTSTAAHKEQVAALNKRINDITARSEAAFSAILRTENVSGALEEERDRLRGTVANIQAENKRLRKVCADAARKISEDVRDDGPCGREALTDVYIMLNEAANRGKE